MNVSDTLKLSKVILRNFGSYEAETSFDLSASPLLICGDTGVGKTSIIEAIFACLTGGNLKEGVSLNEMISHFPTDTDADRSKRELKTVLFFENKGVFYKSEISKTLKSSQKTVLSVLENGAYVPKFTQQEAQKELEAIVGVSAKALLSTNILKQGQGSFFNKLKKSEKKDMVFEFFSLKLFEAIQEKATKELREKEKEYDILARTNFNDTEELNALRSTAFDRKNRTETIAESLKTAQNARYEIENQKKVFDEIRRKKAKVSDLSLRIAQYQNENTILAENVLVGTHTEETLTSAVLTIESEISELQKKQLLKTETVAKIESKNQEVSMITNNMVSTIGRNEVEIARLSSSIPNFVKKTGEELSSWTEEKAITTLETLQSKKEGLSNVVSTLNREIALLESQKNIIPRELAEREQAIAFLRQKDPVTDKRYVEKKDEVFAYDVEAKRLQDAIRELTHMCDGECPTCHQNVTVNSRELAKGALMEKFNATIVQKETANTALGKLKLTIEKEIKSDIIIAEENLSKDKEIYISSINAKIEVKKSELVEAEETKTTSDATIEKLSNGLIRYFADLKIHDRIEALKNENVEMKKVSATKIASVQAELSTLSVDTIDYQTTISQKQSVLSEERDTLQKFRKSESAKATIAKNTILISDMEKEIAETALIGDVNEDASMDTEERLKEAQVKITELEGETFALRRDDERLVMLETKMVDFLKISKSMADEIEVITEMTELYSRDGIPTELIKEIAPDVEEEGNKYLSKFSWGRYSMKFVFEEEKSSGKGTKQEFDIKIFHESVGRKYSQLSGGEQTWIDWAQHIAFAKVLYKKFNKPFIDLLIIDEGFGTQGNNTLPKVVSALYVLQEEFSNILIISHHPALQEVFTNRVEVKKNEMTGRSFID